ncbi:dihydrofolate reductase [Natranaerovirga hydrolytica]|uniref:Dihydrofolate reductase n=1 Tax=Natranaerovirga hydrolytica TaxID=680378 RepID=A0A4R1MIX4_9FIRM|nr:dihydrofolate reductase [Natranaerovirga hydrolytica]TCK92688.1 dihydrofolate reductase [Natranaerovirga hydrolytica]
MIISHIVAIAKNNVIGKDNDIPWRIPGEQLRFKELTMNNTVIMGRKTYESLGRKLKGRDIIVISKTLEENNNQYRVAHTINKALEMSKGKDEVFIAGGGQLYKDTLHLADKLYITVLDDEIEGTIFYPKIDESQYNVTFEKYVTEAVIPYTYYTYERLNFY